MYQQVRYVRAIDPSSFKPNGHEDIIAAARDRAAKKPKILPGQNGKKGKWAKNVMELASEVPTVSEKKKDVREIIELLSDNEDVNLNAVDENKIFSVKVQKEDIPKCWIEVYLLMPKGGSVDSDSFENNCEESVIKTPTNATNVKINGSIEGQDNMIEKNDVSGKSSGGTSSRRSSRGKKSSIPTDSNLADDEIIKPTTPTSTATPAATKAKENKLNSIDDIKKSDVRTEGRYVQIDLFNGGPKVGAIIDQPKNFENSIRSRRPVSYVVAVSESGLMVDVTSRYSSTAGNTKKLRLPQIEWWDELIKDTIKSSILHLDKKKMKNTSSSQVNSKLSSSNSSFSSSFSNSSNSKSNSKSNQSVICLEEDANEIFSIVDDLHTGTQGSSSDHRSRVSIDSNSFTVNGKHTGNKNNEEIEREKEREIEREKTSEINRLLQQLKAEQNEFASQALLEPMPLTLSGFKNHPLYILERDIKVRIINYFF